MAKVAHGIGRMAKKIFSVDDDVMLADQLRSSFPHQVEVFHTGQDRLARLNGHPDLVILDHHLNNTVKNAADGLQILQRIKKLDRQVHVIMLSSQTQYGIALQTVQTGAEQSTNSSARLRSWGYTSQVRGPNSRERTLV